MFGGFVSLKREKQFLIQLLTEKKSDTIFLQETCGTPGVENYGIIMCSLVTSRNIVGAKWILVKDKSDYEVKECQKDGQGRFVLLKVLNQCSFWRNSKTTRWIRTRGKLSGDHWRWLSCYSRCWFGWKWKKTSSKRNLVEKSTTCVQLDWYLAVKKSSGWRRKLTQQYNAVWTFRLISCSKREWALLVVVVS